MILNNKTLEKLRNLINEETEYRSGSRLIQFFNELGLSDSYGQGFPARWRYTDEKLAQINGTPILEKCIKNVLAPINFIENFDTLDCHINDFNKYLAFDQLRVIRNQAEITFQKLERVEIDESIEMTDEPFSKRHRFHPATEVEISIRYDAPNEFRGVLPDIAYVCGYKPKSLRTQVCRVLMQRQDATNWSDPNIYEEVRYHFDNCEWYRVYDVIEALYLDMRDKPREFQLDKFVAKVNEYFIENGIGWKLIDGRIEVRGPEALQNTVEIAKATLDSTGLQTAKQELNEALADLSRRPDPDVSGAIQHAMAALECVAREVTGDPKATLGEIMRHQSMLVPKPLDQAISKVWGYASQYARHIREDHVAEYEEAQLIVGICAAVSTYLCGKEKA